MRGGDSACKRLCLPFRQNRQRSGVGFGGLAHLGVRIVIDPGPLTVGVGKYDERGYRDIRVLLHPGHKRRVTGKVALLANTSVGS